MADIINEEIAALRIKYPIHSELEKSYGLTFLLAAVSSPPYVEEVFFVDRRARTGISNIITEETYSKQYNKFYNEQYLIEVLNGK